MIMHKNSRSRQDTILGKPLKALRGRCSAERHSSTSGTSAAHAYSEWYRDGVPIFAGLLGASALRAGLRYEHRFQMFPCSCLAVVRHVHPDPLLEKRIHILDQRGDYFAIAHKPVFK